MHWRVTKCLQERELNNSRQFVSSSFTPLLYHLLLQAPKVPAGRGCREGTRALWNPHIPPEGQHLPQEQQLCWEGCPAGSTGTRASRAWVGNVHRDPLCLPSSAGQLRHQRCFNFTRHQQALVCAIVLGKHSSSLVGKGN